MGTYVPYCFYDKKFYCYGDYKITGGQNKLRLDDPVSLYIPELKNHQLTTDTPVVTLRDLLTHSAGFPTDDPWGDRQFGIRVIMS